MKRARRPGSSPRAPRYVVGRLAVVAAVVTALALLAAAPAVSAPAAAPPAARLAASVSGSSRATARTPDSVCLECHTGANLDSAVVRGRTVKLDIDRSVLQHSAHANVACTQCHVGFNPEEQPHRAHATPVDCRRCHMDADSAHVFHAKTSFAKSASAVGSCQGCHGAHDVAKQGAATTAAGARAVDAACARCHTEQVSHYENSAHGRAAAHGERAAPTCISCHRLPVTAARAGIRDAQLKLAQEQLCLHCHLDDPVVRNRVGPQVGFIRAYETSIHGQELRKGNAKAATCIDCHGSHEMARGFEPTARTEKFHIPQTCGRCHDKIAAVYATSVHGQGVAKGNPDTPVCTDCHGEHTIKKADAPESPVAPENVSTEVCSPCHSSVRLATKYGIKSDRFQTFADSFHGLAVRGGQVSAANCASCHGAHDILPSSDPRSRISAARLAVTCGKCHSGATAAFAKGKVHLEVTRAQEPLLYWIGFIYTLLIVGVVGGMFLHNLVDFVRKAQHKLRIRRGLAPAHEPESRALYVRMTRSERLQHATLLVSFTVLVVTGFMLRFPESWPVVQLRHLWHNLFEARSVIHRVAGVAMVIASLVHLIYLGFTRRGREFLKDMLPRPSDIGDVTGALRYYAGLTRQRPRFGRFSYIEKAEYWALVWGTIVMAGTGVILWFQDPFIALLTKLGWDAARSIHFYEAILATLAILVWHIYFVIFNPDVYPMNLAWLKGTITEEEMEDEHPLELERLKRERPEREPGEAQPAAASNGNSAEVREPVEPRSQGGRS